MLKHVWSILCSKSIIDKDTNNISIIDAFEQLSVNAKIPPEHKNNPVINIPINFELTTLWVKEEREQTVKADIEIDVFNPKGEKAKSFTNKLEVPNNLKRIRSRLKIIGFGLTTSGVYTFKVKLKEEKQDKYKIVAELPLEVNIKLNIGDNKDKVVN